MKKESVISISDERKTYDLQSVARTILPLAKSILGKKGFVEIDILTDWDKIVGAELAAYAFPQSIDFKRGEKTGGTLLVAVASGAFALELQHREKAVISKINTYFGYNAVSGMKIIQNSGLAQNAAAVEKSDKAKKSLVTAEEETYIKKLSEGMENPALQEVLQRLGHSIINHNKGEKK